MLDSLLGRSCAVNEAGSFQGERPALLVGNSYLVHFSCTISVRWVVVDPSVMKIENETLATTSFTSPVRIQAKAAVQKLGLNDFMHFCELAAVGRLQCVGYGSFPAQWLPVWPGSFAEYVSCLAAGTEFPGFSLIVDSDESGSAVGLSRPSRPILSDERIYIASVEIDRFKQELLKEKNQGKRRFVSHSEDYSEVVYFDGTADYKFFLKSLYSAKVISFLIKKRKQGCHRVLAAEIFRAVGVDKEKYNVKKLFRGKGEDEAFQVLLNLNSDGTYSLNLDC